MKTPLALVVLITCLTGAGLLPLLATGTTERDHAQAGFLLGVQMQPRKIAALVHSTGITDANELVTAVAVCLSESQGFDRAYNDNVDATGKVLSRDVGLFQINIPASKIGTQTEFDLYDRQKNVEAAVNLWINRGFQPWAAFNSNVYLHDTYLQRASLGVMNYLAEQLVLQARAVGQVPGTRVPMVSWKQVQALYR